MPNFAACCSDVVVLVYAKFSCVHVLNLGAAHNISIQQERESDGPSGIIYTDNSLEFTRACEDSCWNYDQSTPYRPETD